MKWLIQNQETINFKHKKLASIMKETEELVAIIYKSIETAKSNMQRYMKIEYCMLSVEYLINSTSK